MAADRTEDESRAHNAAQFATTHWSVVLAAGDSTSPDSQEALEKLCRQYWYPLYAFIRRRGYGPEEAEELTQGFFEHLIERGVVSKADRALGRFRSFLLGALKNVLADAAARKATAKRGGRATIVPWDKLNPECRYAKDLADRLTPDLLFERSWAVAVLDEAMNLLDSEYCRSGRQALFEQLQTFLEGRAEPAEYHQAATRLGMTEGAVRTAVHRLRSRYREMLRAVVGTTVSDARDVEEELNHLMHLFGNQ